MTLTTLTNGTLNDASTVNTNFTHNLIKRVKFSGAGPYTSTTSSYATKVTKSSSILAGAMITHIFLTGTISITSPVTVGDVVIHINGSIEVEGSTETDAYIEFDVADPSNIAYGVGYRVTNTNTSFTIQGSSTSSLAFSADVSVPIKIINANPTINVQLKRSTGSGTVTLTDVFVEVLYMSAFVEE